MRRKLLIVLIASVMCLVGTSLALAQLQYNLDEYEQATGKKITFQESPMLRVKVAAGELPSVEQRLPENPVVMEPWEEVGKYGGVLNWVEFTIGDDHYLRHYENVGLMELASSASYNTYNYIGAPIVPGILEFWEQSEDAKTFTFRIRKGLKWSDGVPVTTEDMRYAIEDVVLNKEIYPVTPRLWRNVEEVEVVDDYTIRLKFTKAQGLLIGTLARGSYQGAIKPKHYLKQFHTLYTPIEKMEPLMEKKGYSKDEWGKFYSFMDYCNHQSLVGKVQNVTIYPVLFPWVVVDEPNPGEYIFERNPYYFKVDTEGNQLPYIDKLHRTLVTNLEVENMKILSGETDVQFQFLKLEDYPLLVENKERGGYEVLPLKCWQDQMLMFWLNLCYKDPVLRDIMQDVRFRQAMSLALNREDISEALFLGFGRPAQIAPLPGSVFYEEEYEKAYIEYDIERANKLLDEMGLKWDENHQYRLRPDGERLIVPLTYYEVTPPSTRGSELASEYWGDIGIDVPVKNAGVGLFWKMQSANEVALSVWWLGGANIVDPYWYGGFQVTTPLWWQWYQTEGEKGVEPVPAAKRAYELHDIILSTSSDEERIEAGKELWRLQAENLWVMGTVASTPSPFVYSKKLGNISVAQEKDYYSITIAEAAEQWFFKE